MSSRIKHVTFVLTLIAVGFASSLLGQQKGQWAPGQLGLNAGVIPDPGITYANLAMNFSASQLNDSNENHILQNVTVPPRVNPRRGDPCILGRDNGADGTSRRQHGNSKD